MGSGANSTSRIGFRGSGDLGGGLSASFWLEGATFTDSGSCGTTSTNNQTTGTTGGGGLTFWRRATVGLAGACGGLRLGRDYSDQYYNRFGFDPFGNIGVGGSQANAGRLGGPTHTRASNANRYFLPPKLGGVYGKGQIELGENASNSGETHGDGKSGGVRVGYQSGAPRGRCRP